MTSAELQAAPTVPPAAADQIGSVERTILAIVSELDQLAEETRKHMVLFLRSLVDELRNATCNDRDSMLFRANPENQYRRALEEFIQPALSAEAIMPIVGQPAQIDTPWIQQRIHPFVKLSLGRAFIQVDTSGGETLAPVLLPHILPDCLQRIILAVCAERSFTLEKCKAVLAELSGAGSGVSSPEDAAQ